MKFKTPQDEGPFADHYIPHHYGPYPSELHESLPIEVFRARIKKRSYGGKCEEVMDEKKELLWNAIFRLRLEGFVLCLN